MYRGLGRGWDIGVRGGSREGGCGGQGRGRRWDREGEGRGGGQVMGIERGLGGSREFGMERVTCCEVGRGYSVWRERVRYRGLG